MKHQNWAGNYTYRAARLHVPETVAQAQELVKRLGSVKALGSRHSFNAIADTAEDQISMERLDEVVAIDRERRAVTVMAGIKYGALCRRLDEAGCALHNLASLPHISVGGAIATATHGSGIGNGNLASAVSALEIVTADGEIRALSREHDGERFHGAVVHLGALGLVTKVTLDILPRFTMRQFVYENLPLAELEANFDAIEASAYSVSLFTDWRDAAFTQVWLKQIVTADAPPPEPVFFGAKLATVPHHPLAGLSAENCTAQLGVPGAWYERLPHFRMDFTPSNGAELQTEYLVPIENAVAALYAVAELREQIAPLLFVSEIRTIAADSLWMSPCCGRACAAIHFTWKPDWAAVEQLLPAIEARLAPFDARPHWGKLFTMPPAQIQPLYERLPDFRRLAAEFDPNGKFRNAFLSQILP